MRNVSRAVLLVGLAGAIMFAVASVGAAAPHHPRLPASMPDRQGAPGGEASLRDFGVTVRAFANQPARDSAEVSSVESSFFESQAHVTGVEDTPASRRQLSTLFGRVTTNVFDGESPHATFTGWVVFEKHAQAINVGSPVLRGEARVASLPTNCTTSSVLDVSTGQWLGTQQSCT